MTRFYILLIFFQVLGYINLYAQQEICNNGIDDDGDGFVDCYDKDCSGNAACEDFFMGEEANCEAKPTEFPLFSLKIAGVSGNETASTLSRVTIGDLDQDGIPEIVVTNRHTKTMHILSGRPVKSKFNDVDTLPIIQKINLAYEPEHGVSIGDVDKDGYAEIFVSGRNRAIEAYSVNKTTGKYELLWKSNSNKEGAHEKGRPVVLGLADFNEDGVAELYYRNEIRNALTGLRLVNGVGNWEQSIPFGPVAVDILDDGACADCQGLELVSGGVIYSVDLGNGTKDNGKITQRKKIPSYSIKDMKGNQDSENWSSASVADYNLDGHLDVLASGASGSPNGATTVFFWDIKNDKVRSFKPANNDQGTGRLNIADIDGDGKMNTTFVSGNRLYALDEEFDPKWDIGITEVSSGATGTTVFDFNGDGAYETVYRDEKNLYIIDGKTGTKLQTIECRSRTSTEYPVVADVDGDGATEICLVCNQDNTIDEREFGNHRYGHVRVYKSNGENWVPSRKVWNQHTYFNVNINDDLTIPRQMQKHYIPFGTGNCEGKIGENRPLNTFLNQSPRLDINGCPTYGAPDFAIADNSVVVTPPTCPGEDFTVSFTILNKGDIGVSGDVPITFYVNDPFVAGSTRLNTTNFTVNNLKPGESVDVTDMLVQGTGAEFTLFISVNDGGTGTPPLTSIVGPILECNGDNNLASAEVNPFPFQISVRKEKDHYSCGAAIGSGAIPNGAAKAFVPINGAEVTAGYTFYWYEGSDLSVAPQFVGAIQTELEPVQYTVQAVHDEANCKSITQTVIINTAPRTLKVSVEKIQDITACENDLEESLWGKLKAVVKDENDNVITDGNFSYEWYEGNNLEDPDYLASEQEVATFLKIPAVYSVKVVDNSSGCFSWAGGAISNMAVIPNLSLNVSAHITRCDQPEGGEIVATASPSDPKIIINWYKGSGVDKNKLLLGINGTTLSGIAAGEYTAQAVNTFTGCASDPEEITVEDWAILPEINVSPVHNTACDVQKANGSISVSISTPSPGSGTSGYDVEWYHGSGTAGSKVDAALLDGTGLKNLPKGQYTVVVTNKGSNCAEEKTVSILDQYKTYELEEGDIAANTVCSETPTIKYNGQIEVHFEVDGNLVTGDDLNDYTFVWKDGDGNVITGENGPALVGYPQGTYTLTIEDNSTGCTAIEPFPLTIPYEPAMPSLELIPTPATHCNGTPNGSLEAIVKLDGQTITSGYSLRWFYESTGNEIPTSQIGGNKAGELEGNTRYKVTVTLDASNCSYEITNYLLQKDSADPVLSLNGKTGDNTVCDPDLTTLKVYNGSISLKLEHDSDEISLPDTDYDIHWYFEDEFGIETQLSFAGLSAQNLKDGKYRIVAENTVLGCASSDFRVTVNKENINLETNIFVTPQTSCDDNAPNGALGVQMINALGQPVDIADFSFAWFNEDGDEISTTDGVDELAAGDYTLKAVSKITGCEYTGAKYVPNQKITPVVTLNISKNIDCDGQGKIQASISAGNPADYTFSWYDEENQLLSQAGPEISVWGGKYSVIALNNNTKCQSIKKFITIDEPAFSFTIAPAFQAYPNNCTDNSGKIAAVIWDGGIDVTTDYNISWHHGHSDNFPSTFYTNPQVIISGSVIINDNPIVENLYPGGYTVVAINKNTGCKKFLELDLPFIDAQEVELEVTVKGEDKCNPQPKNGEISVKAATMISGSDQSHYHYYLYKGSNPSEDPSLAYRGPQQGIVSATDPGTIFDNLEVGTYTLVAYETYTGNNTCSFASKLVTLPQLALPPLVDLQSVMPNTQCDNSNGSITFEVKKDNDDPTTVTSFSYEILRQADNSLALSGSNLAFATAVDVNGIPTGKYYLSVVDDGTTCEAELLPFEILSDPQKPSLPLKYISITDQTYCPPNQNGRISIDDMDFGGEIFNPGNFTFDWTKDGVMVTPDPATPNIIEGLEAGTYKVVVTRSSPGDGYGCSVEREIVVGLKENEFAITFTPEHNTNCSPLEPNGSVTVTAEINGQALSAGSTYAWYAGKSATGSVISPMGLEPGWYTLKVTDFDSQCSYESSVEIKDRPLIPAVATLAKTDQTTCSDNGRIWVTAIEFNGTTSSDPNDWVGEYTFVWYDGNGIAIPGANTFELNDIAAGTYTVETHKVNDPGKTCESPRVSETIKFIDPGLKVTLTPVANTACDLNSANGSLTATAVYKDGSSPTSPVYKWWKDGNEILGANMAMITGLEPGKYTVSVTDGGKGCTAGASSTIRTEEYDLQISAFNTIPQFTCNPSGSITITGLNLGDVSQYEFRWYKGAHHHNNLITVPDGMGGTTPLAGPLLENISGLSHSIEAGFYYVEAIRLGPAPAIGCESTPLRIKLDEAKIFPAVQLITDLPLTSCDPNAPNGRLEVVPAGQDDHSSYTYEWYVGQSATGSVLSTSANIGGRDAGIYTLKITNTNTECSATTAYRVDDKRVYPALTGSASPVTNCEVPNGSLPNGSLYANVHNMGNTGRTFDYYWYEGHLTFNPADGSEIGTGKLLENRRKGLYTVFAVETGPNSLGCNASPLHLEIVERTSMPQPSARMDMAVTNCDPAKANGQASADVNGDYINYTFRWWNAAGEIVANGPIASRLPAGTYKVEAVSKTSACSGTTDVTITESPVVIVMTETDLKMRERTSCAAPNGSLIASVGGETNGYTFHWFRGTTTAAANRIPNQHNPVLSRLDAGIYTVYAVWNRTGCASNPVTKEVGEKYIMPEIKVATIAAVCGEENGLASLMDLKGNVFSVEWNLGFETIINEYQVNLSPGSFSVTVTSYEGCSTTLDFEVPVEIKVFNGITPNNDGENDFFAIDCIENFTSNNVKVYNRAGTLVYEMQGYNNFDKVFVGEGNKGVYLQGNKLPAGTYFYIVEKGNGSKPTSGYLELIR